MIPSIRRERANAIRFLSIDAVQKANSGHPGMPMGMADIAEVLWHDVMKYNPSNPAWTNRDRFVLSNGHGCMLLYSLLHLTGYDLSITDLKQFRQLHSKTPGHPEYGHTPGVETTTGPLGQGLGNAVGMAIAEKHLSAHFNRPGFDIVNHHIYCFVGDGDLMEGVSHEVCSLAGNLKLGKLIVFYDDNGISIDGEVKNWFSDQTALRFEAYGWHVLPAVNGHDAQAIHNAILAAQAETMRPTLICCQTTIGFGAPNLAGSEKTHGAPLGEDEIQAARKQLNWPYAPFEIPSELYAAWDHRDQGKAEETKWQDIFTHYTSAHPELAHEFNRRMANQLPADWPSIMANLISDQNLAAKNMATRKASQQCLDVLANYLPELIGGSADLTESNCTNWRDMQVLTDATPIGRYLHYGVREFGMSTIMNGLALYGGIIPFGGTFLTFSDYARNAIRLSAIMKQRVIYVYTHDSIGLGEDGPTHQPIEQLPSLRFMPGLSVWRPCDTIETAKAWQHAIEHSGPTAILLSRQTLAFQKRTAEQIEHIKHGGYILLDPPKEQSIQAILIATGSEVALAVEAYQQLLIMGILVRVIAMPSVDVFLSQPSTYQNQVLPDYLPIRIAIEAASGDDWWRFVGQKGTVVGISRFGASAPAKDVFEACDLTVEHIVAETKRLIKSVATQTICE